MFQINTIHNQNILIKQSKITEDNMEKWTLLQNTTWIFCLMNYPLDMLFCKIFL